MTRDNPEMADSDNEEESNSLALLNNNFSIDDRIDLLIKTFT